MRSGTKKKVLRYIKIYFSTSMDSDDTLRAKRIIYNKRYYDKHKEQRLDRFWCGICHGTFNSYNKSSHFRTMKHRKADGQENWYIPD